jgi:hypothetical protein
MDLRLSHIKVALFILFVLLSIIEVASLNDSSAGEQSDMSANPTSLPHPYKRLVHCGRVVWSAMIKGISGIVLILSHPLDGGKIKIV